MADRPIQHGADGLGAAGDGVLGDLAGLAGQVSDDVETVRRLVTRAGTGRGPDPSADVAALGDDLRADLDRLGEQLRAALAGAAREVEELRRPAPGPVAPPSPSPPVSPPTPGAAPDPPVPAVVEVSTSSGRREPALRNPPPDSLVEVDRTVAYTTDEHGRVVRARTVLTRTTPGQPRDSYAQRTVRDRLPGDHAGHIIPRILGGIGKHINLVPMEGRRVNKGQYATLENIWRRAVAAGKQVQLEVRLRYDDRTHRPHKIIVQYEIDGRMHKSTIRNTPASERSP